VIASLGMYERPQTRAATTRFWHEIRNRLRQSGIDAPDDLERGTPFGETWGANDLVFSQTCGRPYRLDLCDRVTLVGTPDYDLKGCAPGYYRSGFVVRARDPRYALADFAETVFAYNETLSQSGWAAAQCHAAKNGFQFSKTLETGGHAASARAVAEGRADIAALDALTWDLVKRYNDFSLGLRVLDWTAPSPGLPYITGKTISGAVVANAVSAAISALSIPDRAALRLRGLVQIPKAAYMAVPNP